MRALEKLSTDEGARKQFLLRQLKAVAARADFLSRVQSSRRLPSFDEEARQFFAIQLAPKASPELVEVRRKIAALLVGRGRLVDRYASFEQRFVIPENKVPAVISRSLELCREETRRHLELPTGEGVVVEYVRNKPWSAFSTYKGRYRSVIQINVDLGLTVDRALQLACHEGYPGHHVFNSLAEQNLALEKHRPEWLIQPTFSPQSFLSEASATAAAEVAFSASERARLEEEILFPLADLKAVRTKNRLRIEELVDALHPAELAIARDYVDERLEFARAAAALENQALMSQTDATLRYLNEYRSYVVTYTEGRDQVISWINKRAERGFRHDRWKAFADLLQSPDLFWQP